MLRSSSRRSCSEFCRSRARIHGRAERAALGRQTLARPLCERSRSDVWERHPDERGGAQDVRDLFLKLQTTIEAIDRALVDEQEDGAARSWPLDESRESLRDGAVD
jgi:hypothetical protein